MRFLISGGIVFVLSLVLTTGLHAAGLAFQLALLIAYSVAIAVHLQLHRRFTFAGEGAYVLSQRRQALRFGCVVLLQYAFMAGSVAIFAPLLDLPELVVYLAAIAVMSAANYLALAARVFHAHSYAREMREG
ncbi:MAG TPA: GtrA family protein [Solirubrobacter sp.]